MTLVTTVRGSYCDLLDFLELKDCGPGLICLALLRTWHGHVSSSKSRFTYCWLSHLGLGVATGACDAAQGGGPEPADWQLQERQVLPEEAHSYQAEQTAVWDRQTRGTVAG